MIKLLTNSIKKINYLEYQIKQINQSTQLQRQQLNNEGDAQRLNALTRAQNEKMHSLIKQELNLQQMQKQKQNQYNTPKYF